MPAYVHARLPASRGLLAISFCFLFSPKDCEIGRRLGLLNRIQERKGKGRKENRGAIDLIILAGAVVWNPDGSMAVNMSVSPAFIHRCAKGPFDRGKLEQDKKK